MPIRSSVLPSAGNRPTSGKTHPVGGGSVGMQPSNQSAPASPVSGAGRASGCSVGSGNTQRTRTRRTLMGIGGSLTKGLAPRVARAAPALSSQFVHEAMRRAVDGVGPLPPAAEAADAQLAEQHGDVEKAVHEVIENHLRYAGVQGFVTNLGGLVTAPLAIPANISGLALIQCREVAGIARLRGYALSDQRVRTALVACILGEDSVRSLVRKKR